MKLANKQKSFPLHSIDNKYFLFCGSHQFLLKEYVTGNVFIGSGITWQSIDTIVGIH